MGKIQTDTRTINIDWAGSDLHIALEKEIEKHLNKDQTYILYPITYRIVNKKMHYATIMKGAKQKHKDYVKKEKERFGIE